MQSQTRQYVEDRKGWAKEQATKMKHNRLDQKKKKERQEERVGDRHFQTEAQTKTCTTEEDEHPEQETKQDCACREEERERD